MTVHFTSDPHFGHRSMAERRGFDSVVDHDLALEDNWGRVVADDDVIYVLGDLAMGGPGYALDLIGNLPGRKRLILGNHDKAHPMNRDAHKWLRAYMQFFESVAQSARIKVDGIEVLLSHFPYERDRGEARHMQWRLPDHGLPLLHGHTHGTERLTVTEVREAPVMEAPRWRTEVHVGLDAWDLTPVSDVAVAGLLRSAL